MHVTPTDVGLGRQEGSEKISLGTTAPSVTASPPIELLNSVRANASRGDQNQRFTSHVLGSLDKDRSTIEGHHGADDVMGSHEHANQTDLDQLT